MPTNDERRKIAAELRENRDPLTPYNLVDYIFDDPWNHDSGEEVAARLADLIEPEERTCHDVSFDSREFVCSWCGCHIDVLDIESEPTMWLGGSPIEPSFCPHCGAKVTGVEE